ncbi:L-lactate dehydrogenase [Microbacterium album]|uniref:L-lactate dehydrogenase n=1 Tax=Microbacterium album TaxID=2053191 RepID=A0A917MMY0_9MICO|nr:L-lactate dehydrogenase [Microbacterium album]GGH47125.1 L-lactate dehydrogenase 2 [Microbacterium album]
MAVIENAKLTIVGAGAVGAATAYASLIRGAARHVVLHDIDAARVEAEALDLAHGSLFTGSSTVTGSADVDATADSHVVVVTAGAPQRPGQTRLELIDTNARIFRTMMPRLVEASPGAVFVIVTNPCDVLTLLAQQQTGLPAERLFASGTVLDTSRLRWRLAERAGVAASSVHAHIVGEHGDTEFPLWSSATIGPVPLLEWDPLDRDPFTPDELDEIAQDVRTAAYRIIAGKGATNYAIGLSATRIVEAVLRDERAVLPVSTVLSDFRGLPEVALSVPSIVGSSGAFPIRETRFSDEEHALLHASAEAIRETADRVRDAA